MPVEITGGKPDLKKLAKKKRIKLTEDGEVKGVPKNNVVEIRKKKIKVEGVVIAEKDIPVNGGHARAEGSVWRVALGGPKKYHEKVLADEKRRLRTGDPHAKASAPELEDEEADEYLAYKDFLKEEKLEIAENEDFYKWYKKANA